MRARLITLAAAIGLLAASSATAVAADEGPAIVDVSAATNHACALLDDGAVACWGSGRFGGLGTGDRYTRVIPEVVNLPGPASAVAAGGEHTCALLTDGSVACWGRNGDAEVGTGKTSVLVPRPVLVAGLDSVVAIGAGEIFSCALRSDGAAWCWGYGGNGQIGPGWQDGMTAPVRVTGVGDVAELFVGLTQTCLRLTDGTVSCFGFYPRGGSELSSPVPTPVPGLAGAVAMAGGQGYECGVMPDGTVRCFGDNNWGQLGDGTYTTHPYTDTVAAAGIDAAVDITASYTHACALMEDGSAACWGFDAYGELGTPPSDGDRSPTPQPLPGVDGITAIAAGWEFTCAVVSGAGQCWGRNDEGELGDRTVVSRTTPAPLSWVPDPNPPVVQAPDIGIRIHRGAAARNPRRIAHHSTRRRRSWRDRNRPLRAPSQPRRWVDVGPVAVAARPVSGAPAHDARGDAPDPGRGPRGQRRELADRTHPRPARPAVCGQHPVPRQLAVGIEIHLLGRDDSLHDRGRRECHLPVHGPGGRDRLPTGADPWPVQGLHRWRVRRYRRSPRQGRPVPRGRLFAALGDIGLARHPDGRARRQPASTGGPGRVRRPSEGVIPPAADRGGRRTTLRGCDDSPAPASSSTDRWTTRRSSVATSATSPGSTAGRAARGRRPSRSSGCWAGGPCRTRCSTSGPGRPTSRSR